MHFQQIFHPASGNEFFVLRKQCFLIRAIFLLVEAIIGIRRDLIFKKAYYCQWTTDFLVSGNHFFLYFSETASDSFFA